jgi:folate-binding protein YgfZ
VSAPTVVYRRRPAGVLEVRGADRVAFLQSLTTNDFRTLGVGDALWSAALSPVGKVLFTFRAAARGDAIRLLVDPERRERAAAHLRKYAIFQDVRVEEPPPPARFDFYGGEPPPPADADVWPRFFELTATWLVRDGAADAVESALGLPAIGEADAEARRIDAGRPAEGREIDETRTADEAGLARAISATKGCYVGQEVVARMRTYGRTPRRLVRLEFAGAPPPAGTVLVRRDDPGREAGRVTSSVLSAASGAVGLGYAARDVEDGEELTIAGQSGATARVVPIGP